MRRNRHMVRGGMLLRASEMVCMSPEPSWLTVIITFLPIPATFHLPFKMLFSHHTSSRCKISTCQNWPHHTKRKKLFRDHFLTTK